MNVELLKLLDAVRAYRAAQDEERRAEQTMLETGARGKAYHTAWQAHRAAVQAVECAEDGVIRAALLLADAVQPPVFDADDTQPMPAVSGEWES